MDDFRIEKDSLGTMQVPVDALYGAQTARAIDNFPISGISLPRPMLRALGLIKKNAAQTNQGLGLLSAEVASAIVQAAEEVIAGKQDEQFPVDIFQTGSGTSSNMNSNEVIANLAAQLLGQSLGSKAVHPNDHVNLGQSSNDVFPSAIHIACAEQLHQNLLPALEQLLQRLDKKTDEFKDVLKIGRTHLQDATPIKLGQVFSGYSRQVELSHEQIANNMNRLFELALGGTAVGTGINTHPDFAAKTIAGIANETGLPFREANNHFEAQGAKDGLIAVSSSLKCCAISLFKIANDIRFLGSGPRCGIGELIIPAVQPGSSIMPGKINPVMAESLMQVCAQVIGNDATVSLSGLSGNFELNVMMPVMAYNVLQSIELLSQGITAFAQKCLDGLQANEKRCGDLLEQSLALVTALVPEIGYDRAADLAKQAHKTGKTLRELALADGVAAETLDTLLDPATMTEPKR
ncbi:fumarase, class II [Desulfuromusa kysingii]|uniref:Fumarate hydratase class II n=1 Tax=Desulfuromusa kysingii TaxID=37625 RepID=A0A1H3VG42_9BACT|nr:class II fumarate hydratase [Desulfuromusa kysingii]SDZ73641.1 fumarase, class II [Desulfuromusa kysingii]